MVLADNGYEYWYLHMNNDAPGTDDGQGGGYHAYGPDIQRGNQVSAGQLLGYVGDSGNSEDTVSHLHLEIVRKDESRVNPYSGLRNNSYHMQKSILDYPKAKNEILPSTPNFTGGYKLAFGDLDTDPEDEIVVGPGEGGKYVKIIDKNGDHLRTFQPNNAGFYGGVDVAVGDVTGDGINEIVTGAGRGGRYVKVFTYTGEHLKTINPYNSLIGVNIAVGNLDEDSQMEIITGARTGGGPRVNTYNFEGNRLFTDYVYSQSFKGGVKVEAGNINTDTPYDEIITISQSGGTPRVKISNHRGNLCNGLTSSLNRGGKVTMISLPLANLKYLPQWV